MWGVGSEVTSQGVVGWRALSGRLKFTVRRHTFDKDALPWRPGRHLLEVRRVCSRTLALVALWVEGLSATRPGFLRQEGFDQGPMTVGYPETRKGKSRSNQKKKNELLHIELWVGDLSGIGLILAEMAAGH